MMPDPSPEAGPGPTSPEEMDQALADKMDSRTQADELLVEQIEEAQDSAT
jgi:hypothetical protein